MIDLVRMPPEISTGFVRSTDWGTSIVRSSSNDATERSRMREDPRRHWQATKGLFSKNVIEETDGFLQARFGAYHAFRFWDPTDFSTNPSGRTLTPGITDQFLGYGDGVRTRFPLRRVYRSTPNDLPQRLKSEDRMLPIHNEVDDRLARKIGLPNGHLFLAMFAANSTPITLFSIDYEERDVVFDSAPAMDASVTMGCYYDWPVILDEDTDRNFEVSAESWNAQNAPNIGLELVPVEKFAQETDDPGGHEEIEWGVGSPLLYKANGIWKTLKPTTTGLSVTIEEPSGLNSGGPHFVLMVEDEAVDVLDEINGSTICTLTAGQTGIFLVRVEGTTRSWVYLIA